jgi:hypothetical protein
LTVLALALLAAEPAQPEPIPAGAGSFVFRFERAGAQRPITVWTWRPDGLKPDSPVLFVMHGTNRHGRSYRDSWIGHAAEHGALLVVPEFSELHYPGGGWYQLGNLHGTPEIGSAEVLDWDRLRRLLAAASAPGASPAAARVVSRVPEKLREGFSAALRSEKLDDAPRLAIVGALNELLDDKELYRPEDFPQPGEVVRAALQTAKHPRELKPGMLRPVNRELLGTALPQCLAAPDYSVHTIEQWTYPAIERLFDEVRARSGSTRKAYLLYGHSAGGQFVQRFVMIMPECRVERAVAANAGKYLWPSAEQDYPYGLGGLRRLGLPKLEVAFARRLTVMAGEEDTAEDAEKDPDLPVSEEAKRQGRHRLERARAFHRAAEAAAKNLGCPLAWELRTVKDVAHSNAGMSGEAVEALFAPGAK